MNQRVVLFTIFTMKRVLLTGLTAWIGDPARQPLVLRGARQVGKTWLVREFARSAGRELLEVNFERDPRRKQIFAPDQRPRMLADLGLIFGTRIDPDRHLLFLDEIQAAPDALAALRWFHEDLPALPVVAAGSLLDFALAAMDHSIPVGRLTYRYLEPMRFDEYLRAHDQDLLLEQLQSWSPGEELGATAFGLASDWFARFAQVGGMPAVVAADVGGAEPSTCRDRQTDLMATFRDEFAKYARRMEPGVLDAVLLATARQLGSKFVYAGASDGMKQQRVKGAIELLAMARVVTLAPHSAANGIPLGGEINERHRKAFLLDVGLLHALLRTPAGPAFPRPEDLAPTVRGQIAEQLAAQTLRAPDPASGREASLHYWQRMGGRMGEIDLLCQFGTRIVPLELKAGAAGSMKSLHQFMHDKHLELAVRADANPPSLQAIDVKTTQGDSARYRLLNLPGFLLFRVQELVAAIGVMG